MAKKETSRPSNRNNNSSGPQNTTKRPSTGSGQSSNSNRSSSSGSSTGSGNRPTTNTTTSNSTNRSSSGPSTGGGYGNRSSSTGGYQGRRPNSPNSPNYKGRRGMPQNRSEHRVNEFIRVPEVRLVGDNFEELSELMGEKLETGVFPTRKAYDMALKAELDLVEISAKGNPPVCRVMDYKKFLYERKKRERELKAKQTKIVIKEIRFGPNTDDHDFEFKLKHAIGFLEDGSKVKAYVQFKGRSIVFKDRGRDLLTRFISALEDYGVPDYPPKMEDRRMHCTLTSKKAKKK